jgi:NADPH:quinone reductase-like Zn-dependent oxidoreductase
MVLAVGVTKYGGPDALHVVEVPEPEMVPGGLRIRVRAAAVNPTDTFVRNGARAEAQRAVSPPPYVPGMDAAGVLEEIGDGARTKLRLGDRVMAIVLPKGPNGAYAEQVVVPTESVVRAPRGASHVEACTLPMNGLTARLALDVLGLAPGQTLAVTGAAGAFGGYVVQLAKADGLRVVADASAVDEPLVLGLGADVVVPRGNDVAARIREVVPGGVDGLADGALLDGLVALAVKDGGRAVTVRGYSGEGERGVMFTPIWVRTYAREQAKLDRLREQAEEGSLTLRVAGVLPPGRAAEAHRLLEAGGVRGRLVIEF